MTAGNPADAIDDALQAKSVAASYGRYARGEARPSASWADLSIAARSLDRTHACATDFVAASHCARGTV